MKTRNSKASRTFNALACALNYLPDKTIHKIHSIIADDRDGYHFDFIAAVNSYRSIAGNNRVSVKPFID